MNSAIEAFVLRLADFYLLTSLLLLIVGGAMLCLRQPAHRAAVQWAATAGIVALVTICMLPRWPRVSWNAVVGSAAASRSADDVDRILTDLTVVHQGVELAGRPGPNAVQTPGRSNSAVASSTARVRATGSLKPASAWRPRQWSRVVAGWFLLGAGLTTAWLAWGAVRTVFLIKRSSQAPDALRAELAEIVGDRSRVPRLLLASGVNGAVALGVFNPAILLPRRICRESGPRELRMLLAHEWAHIHNRDLWLLALGRCLLMVLFPHPLYWWLRKTIRDDQEAMADAAAAEMSGPADYAAELVGWLKRINGCPDARVLAAVGIWERPSRLSRRIAMLLDEKRPIRPKCSGYWRYGSLGLVGILALCLSVFTLRPLPSAEANAPHESASAGEVQSDRTAVESAQQEEALNYDCRLVDRITGDPINGGTVTVRLSCDSPSDPSGKREVLSKTEQKTAADGRFTVTITPQQLARQRLNIRVEADHPRYFSGRGGHRPSALRTIRQRGDAPYFETFALWPEEEISGKVEKPDGTPAEGVKVLAYSRLDPENRPQDGKFADVMTDAEGRFQIPAIQGGETALWLIPPEHAPSTNVLQKRRGDLGTLTLRQGTRIEGRVLDAAGKPISDIWVNASLMKDPDEKTLRRLNVANCSIRAALTDADGRFATAPLPPGGYRVMPMEKPHDNLLEDRTPRPLPAAFFPQMSTLAEGDRSVHLEFRAVPEVTVEVQHFDSSGKPRKGWMVAFGGDTEDGISFSDRSSDTIRQSDETGKVVFKVPKGLQKAHLEALVTDNDASRFRLTESGPLINECYLRLGTLTEDVKDVALILYKAPVLMIRAIDEEGRSIDGFRPKVMYRPDRSPRRGGVFIDGEPSGNVFFTRQADGRWRSSQMLPDERITLTVLAPGYQAKSEEMSLAEGAVKEVEWTLAKE